MARPQRLSSLESMFLALSTPEVPFVPGCILALDHPIPHEQLLARIRILLDDLPRYRQRIARAPLFGLPAWVDDEEFSVERHVGILRIPPPGGQAELESCVAQLLTAPLPEDDPPWRVWTAHGLRDGRGAVIAIVHHALVDGIAGIGLLERLLGIAPAPIAATPAHRATTEERARPLFERVVERVTADVRGRAVALHRLASQPELRRHATVLAELLWQGLHPASDLGLDGHAPTRDHRFATFTTNLDDIKAVKRAFGVTVNDVLLACVSGAVRRQAARRGIDPDRLDDVRALVPVNLHAPGEHATSGNRVALLLAALAVDAADATTRLRRIAQTTQQLKKRDMAGAGDMLVSVSDLTWSGVLRNVFRIALWRRAFNVLITNIPGPQIPLYLLDARVTGFVPIVNLWPHIPVAIAIGSYAGTVAISVHADGATTPDLAPFVQDLDDSFAELRAAATIRPISGADAHASAERPLATT